MTLDLDELERLAKAATPIDDRERWFRRIRSRDFNAHDERLISAATPVAVLALVERVRLAEEWARKGLYSYHGGRCSMAGGPWPGNPRECESPICRQWAEDLLP